jgi:site-specific recombinase XerD
MARTLSERPRWEEMDKSDLPLRTAMEHYLMACRTEGKTPKTLFDYRNKLARFVEWQGGTLGGLDLATGRVFVAHLQESPKWELHPGIPTSKSVLSAQTVAGHARVLKGFATWLAEEDYLPTNTLTRLAKPKVPSRVTEVLRGDEIKRLLDSCDPNSANGGRDLAILTLFLDTGLRRFCQISGQLNARCGEPRVGTRRRRPTGLRGGHLRDQRFPPLRE